MTAPGSSRPLRIALVAGEASGDLLGAGLVRELQQRFPDAEFAGIGGDAMRSAGCLTWFDASELAVMGLTEILRHLPRLLKLRSEFRARVLEWQPDVFIGIDAPDFNLGVERWLKERGITTVHYVSPSVWAWREKRAEKIGASADLVLCLFPMEPPIYARHGIASTRWLMTSRCTATEKRPAWPWACRSTPRCWLCCRAAGWARSANWAARSSKRPGRYPSAFRACTWWCRRPTRPAVH